MASKTLTELSIEELKNQEKTLKLSSGLFIGILIVLCITGLWLTREQGFSVFTVLPLAFLPLLISMLTNLKKIKTELALRNVQ